MSKIILSPSILSADFSNLERDIKRVEAAGADWIHIDVMDGHFVPNITIGIPVVASLRKITQLPLDVHLMIENPQEYIEPFAEAGANILTFHYEAILDKYSINDAQKVNDEIYQIINKIKSFKIKSSISIKPATTPEVLLPFLTDVDMVLIMTVEPGFGGQKFMPECAEKIKFIRQNAPKLLIIQVDGGINAKTAAICKAFGANSLVAGNYIYNSSNIEQAVSSLR